MSFQFRPRKRGKDDRVAVSISREDRAHLEIMAREAKITRAALISGIIHDVVEDDKAAHAA